MDGIAAEFLREVEGYLPDMRGCLQVLMRDQGNREAAEELHRIVHTIKGAAAMVGFDSLSKTGELLEQTMEQVLEDGLVLDREMIDIFSDTTERIAVFCAQDGKEDKQLHKETLTVFARLQPPPVPEPPSDSIAAILDQLLSVSGGEEESADGNENDVFLLLDEELEERVAPAENVSAAYAAADERPSEEDPLHAEPAETALKDAAALNGATDRFCEIMAVQTAQLAAEEQLEYTAEDELFPMDAAEDVLFAAPSAETEDNNTADTELLECFAEEAAEHLENISLQLQCLRAAGQKDAPLTEPLRENLHVLRRSVHTLKGAAAVIGIEPVAAWSRQFEDFLDWLHDDAPSFGPQAVEAIQEGADILARLSGNPSCAIAAERDEVASRFQAVMDRATAESTPAAEELRTEDSSGLEKIVVAKESADNPLIFEELFRAEDAQEDDDDDSLFQTAAPADSLFAPLPSPAAAEAIDPELLECFAEETAEHLENIDLQLKQLAAAAVSEVEISEPLRENLHSLRRSVHTLKGAAAVIGIKPVAAWGHQFEDFLDWLHDESPALGPQAVAAMQDGADILARLAENPASSTAEEEQAAVVHFHAVMTSPHPPAPADVPIASAFTAQPETADLPSAAEADFFSPEEQPEALCDELFPADADTRSAEELFTFAEPAASSAEAESGTEAIDPELLACFAEEAAEHLENVDQQLRQLAAQTAVKTVLSDSLREKLHSLRRSVHTLKGAAAVIGIEAVAAWGHEFEDFLDWLHDESPTLGPQAVAAMQEGADLLVKITEHPAQELTEKKAAVAACFRSVMAGVLPPPAPAERLPEPETASEAPPAQEKTAAEAVAAPPVPANEPQPSGVRRVNTLRVEISKIDQVVGLSGDMVINLGSFEASMSAMAGTLNELGMILQRLKSINHSLEAGYELATIPYLRGAGEAGGGLTEDFDPLEMDRYSELNILIRSLSEAVSDLDSIMAQSALENVAWQKTVERQTRVLKDIQNKMIGLRMTPFSVLSARMQRTIREAERSTGHPAQLVIEGESIMMDTRVWDTMADALMHILRNSVAHGGSPDRQLTVHIKAERRGGQFSLRINDDGKGLDYDAIRAKGMKLYPLERVASMSDEKLAALIFRHGFSSAGAVSNIAGRGVGMDVVRDAVQLLNGSIEIFSARGKGLELLIRLPVSVAQLHVVLVRLAGQIYAVPMHDIRSAAKVKREEISGRDYETASGERLPLINQAAIPGFRVGTADETPPESELAVLLIHVGSRQAALICEQIIGQRDIVFKDLGSHLHNVPCIAGVTIMGDGSLVPIIQSDDLLKKWAALAASTGETTEEAQVQERPLQVLVVDDSISVRKVVSNFLLQQGWQPTVARNGIEALEHIREEKPDLVLLDVEMPRMNGFEVLQALQSQPEFQSIPVIMLTSRSADKYREKASQLGARGFMTKPFKEDEAVDLIRSMTSGQTLAELHG
ncbi:Hpt domain-containing protein [Candidatus Electronema sp. TJ]|uniref:Hpt domain-containing protein n=1 Tax=Candidatus Electronema sp. TJ TaxID=3401573 RepID=UPI003AA83501